MSLSGISLSQDLRQSQVLAPQMRQSLRMLQMTSLELRAELQHQMEMNPVIEDVAGKMERTMTEVIPEEHSSGAISEKELDFTPTGEAAQTTLGCDDSDRDYFLQNMENFSGGTDSGSIDPDVLSRRQLVFDRQVKQETLQEHLLLQLSLSAIPVEDQELAEILIEYIDNDGYFRGSLPDIQMIAGTTEAKLLSVLKGIQQLDPVGCGGRNLREVLLPQIDNLEDSPWEDEVRSLVENHLENIAAHREALICRDLNLTPEEYRQALKVLRSLEPVPGRKFERRENSSIYIRPEVFVERNKKGEWIAEVSGRDLPEIRISQKYLNMLKDPNCTVETKSYIRERVRAAEVLVESIANRQETIRNIAQCIVDAQEEVFEKKSMSALKPLTMDQIAAKVGVHSTTVSRTVRDKYMSTPMGVVEMRRFFVTGLSTENGDAVSNVAVIERIRQIIAAEDHHHPLSDEDISKLLKQEGISAARRTVTKYRISLGIPGTKDRRQ